MKYSDGEAVKVGDIFTDGCSGREDVRTKNRAKVLYVDRWVLVWFPLNDYTAFHGGFRKQEYVSQSWCLSSSPKKVELSELTAKELEVYHSVGEMLSDESE